MTEKKFRPMLSGVIDSDEDLDNLIYPVICSPKLDGIRALVKDNKFVTRSMKDIPNKAVQKYMEALTSIYPFLWNKDLSELDGELMFGHPSMSTDHDIFNKTTKALMSFDGEPELTYWVFDSFKNPEDTHTARAIDAGFLTHHISKALIQLYMEDLKVKIHFKVLESQVCYNSKQILEYENQCIEKGFEGIMIRKPDMPYKFGRSAKTKTQQHLLKLKRFADAEAEIIGFEELLRNENEQTEDAFGNSERASCQDQMVPGNTLGAFKVKGLCDNYKDIEFKVGSGFTQEERQRHWDDRDNLIGKVITYNYQPIGCKDAPRFPVFKGFREDF